MGGKLTKYEAPLPSTPELKLHSLKTTDQMKPEQPECLDPRSPSDCRTPINVQSAAPPIASQHETVAENTLGVLRKRFLKKFSYNLNDPRSPSMLLNRTPLIFDPEIDKTLNLDDTFADLFVESQAPIPLAAESSNDEKNITEHNQRKQVDEHLDMQVDHAADTLPHAAEVAPLTEEPSLESSLGNNTSIEYCSLPSSELEEETMPCPAVLLQTPIALQQQLMDPRSPTIGVERTPMIFSDDDDEASEDAMLEHILAKLSMNTSSASSCGSFGTPPAAMRGSTTTRLPPNNFRHFGGIIKPANKHLDRVLVCAGGRKHLVPPTRRRQHQQRIYEDKAGDENSSPSTTPKQKSFGEAGVKRTPLSCVKNRSTLRSRSMEPSEKSLKVRLPRTSYDDSAKTTLLQMMQGSDTIEF